MFHSYQLAERFISQQGEGIYTGTLMGFLRFTGCSVGKKICQHCDTDFENMDPWKGGGPLTLTGIQDWVTENKLRHVCFTGGEPLDQPNLEPLTEALIDLETMIHVETSGTVKYPDWLSHDRIWITMSPKPGYLVENFTPTHEFKIIVSGLGVGNLPPGTKWPTIEDALFIAENYRKPVFLQPRNKKYEVDFEALRVVQDLVRTHPQLRMSIQLHKLLKVR